MRSALVLILIVGFGAPAFAPPLPRFNFTVEGEVVRADYDEIGCSILAKFYGANGIEGQCERRV